MKFQNWLKVHHREITGYRLVTPFGFCIHIVIAKIVCLCVWDTYIYTLTAGDKLWGEGSKKLPNSSNCVTRYFEIISWYWILFGYFLGHLMDFKFLYCLILFLILKCRFDHYIANLFIIFNNCLYQYFLFSDWPISYQIIIRGVVNRCLGVPSSFYRPTEAMFYNYPLQQLARGFWKKIRKLETDEMDLQVVG